MWSHCGLIPMLQIFLLLITPIHGQYRDGDIRLVGGSYQWEGRVEIYFSGTWGTITDSDWTSDDAQVVCRKLGHFKPGATAHADAYFGEGSGLIHLTFVKCSGLEYDVTECETQNLESSFSHSLDVGVKCQPADEAYREGDIRLVGGSYNWEGRVEIYWSGTWGAISDSSWTAAEANVACKQLRHSSNGIAVACCDSYGVGSGMIAIRVVRCLGSETNVTTCSYVNNTVLRSNQMDVGVQCEQGDEIKEGDIRLVGGGYLWKGRVEIFLSGVWGTVSSYYWTLDHSSATVVCRQLGYNTYNVDDYCCGAYGQGTGPVHIADLSCHGSEYRINNCRYNNFTQGKSHYMDWSAVCSVVGPESGDAGLSGTNSGQVQVFLSGMWVPVANSHMSWTLDNAAVVCRELGYAPNETSLSSPKPYDDRIALNRLDNVHCTGTELKLTDCSFDIVTLISYTSTEMACGYIDCSDGDIRLVGGENKTMGRVEVCSDRRWGTVCDNQWTDNHTAVVCRQLGFSDIIGNSIYYTSGGGAGPIFMDYVNCTGSEPRLWRKCSHFSHYYGCSHNDDVGVQCQPASCSDGQIKLIEGYTELYGRVEICSHQRWETLSYNHWSSSVAKVVCIELGYSTYNNWRTQFGRGGGPIHPNYYQCTGNEGRLTQCESHNETISRTHSDDVGIYCRSAICSDGEVRLAEGETEWDGRVEICFGLRWGVIRSEIWSQTNSRVVCNDLGYDITDESNNLTIPQALSKPVYLHTIVCSSRDLTLLECGFTRDSGNTTNIQDAIVKCRQPSCDDGDLKLVGGASENDGRLEVCFNKRWGTIDEDGWTHTDTQVACRQLGYSTSDVSHTKSARTSQSLPVYMTLVGCYSSEERLIDCAYHDFIGSKSTSMDVSISCSSDSAARKSDEIELNSVSVVSLSVAVFCASTLIILAALLIIRHILRQKKKKYTISKETPTQEMQDTHTVYRYLNNDGIMNGEKMDYELDDMPMHSYKEVNTTVIPPKPKPKPPPKKPNLNTLDSTRHVRSSKQQNVCKPATIPRMRPQFHGQVQRSESPEVIYEIPD